jgi:hypothetical protein
MEIQSMLNLALISVGAIVMLVSIVQSNQFGKLTRCVRTDEQGTINLYFTIHRALMAFFLLGYIGAIAAILMDFPLLSESFVSFIFLFGSVFVYLCVVCELRLLQEISAQNDD